MVDTGEIMITENGWFALWGQKMVSLGDENNRVFDLGDKRKCHMTVLVKIINHNQFLCIKVKMALDVKVIQNPSWAYS